MTNKVWQLGLFGSPDDPNIESRRFKLVNRHGNYIADGEQRGETYRVFDSRYKLGFHDYPESELDAVFAEFDAIGMQYMID